MKLERDLSSEEIIEVQRQAWSETYRYVAAHSPFYQEHFRRAGLSLNQPLDISELSRVPTVDKSALSQNAERFLCVPPAQVVDIVTTSGSTGQPLVWMLTDRDLERLARNEELSFTCAGLDRSDIVLLAVALDRCFMAGLAYFLGLRRLGCGVIRVGPSTPAMHLDMMRRVGVTAVVGVPSFLSLLADKAAEAQVDLTRLSVRKAICIGEPIRSEKLVLNRAGENIARRWQARVLSTYGVTELAASLCECEAGCGGHIHPELLLMETLDEQGRSLPDGEVGELTATTLGVEGMPLVRYRTGDCAAIYREPCPCGRRTLRIGPIVGRKDHKLKCRGTTLFPSTLKAVLDSVPGVISYAIVARRETALSDDLEVRVVCAEDPGRLFPVLRERFQGEAKVAPRITAVSLTEIEALQMPEGTRKRRFFVDLRE
jgi:phenylacetate-CoA ligase